MRAGLEADVAARYGAGRGATGSRRLTDAEVAAIAEAGAGGAARAGAPALARRARSSSRSSRPKPTSTRGSIRASLGLFNGTAYPDASHLGGQPGLTQILIFRRNLERMAGSDEELREEIRTTLIHETGHFFGLGDEELEGVGLG